MIYTDDKSGVTLVEHDGRVDDNFVIGYRVRKVERESTIRYRDLPEELRTEYAKVTNKIARYLEQGDEDVEEHSFYDGKEEAPIKAESTHIR